MIRLSRALRFFSIPGALALSMSTIPLYAQAPPAMPDRASVEKGTGYYNYSLGHLYAGMAQQYNRQDYTTKAIEYYRLALKQDPSISFITEELTDLYIQSGQLQKAVTEAEELLRQKPEDLGARRILGRVYTRLIGDPQQGKVDQNMLKKSIEQYSKIVEKEPADTESQLLLARLYRLDHNLPGAEAVYKTVLAKEPDNDESLTGLAAIYSDNGDSKNAIELLKKAGDQNPSPRTLVMLATMLEQASDYAGAADAWQRAMQLAPDNERWKRALAQDLLFSDKLEEARKLYEEIAAESPKDSQIQLHLAEIYLQQRDLPKARTALNAAKGGEADNMELRSDEVILLEAEGKSDEAIKSMKAILADTSKPEFSAQERAQRNRFQDRLGVLYRSAGKYPLAVSTFREIPTDDQEVAIRESLQIVETYRMAKDMAAARKESDALVKKFPKNRGVVLEHATILADAGKIDQAVTEVDSLRDGKIDRELVLAEAQLYDRAKRYPDALGALDRAEKLSKAKSETIDIRFRRGAMLEKTKDFASAEAEFRKILKDDPENAGALNYLGYMLADRNVHLDEAQQLIAKAVALEPGNYAYLDSLGWVYYRQNRLEAAEDQLRRALDRMNTDPTVHDHLGDVLLKQGRVKEAVVQWQASVKNWEASVNAEADPTELAKVQKKLEDARVRIAQQSHGNEAH